MGLFSKKDTVPDLPPAPTLPELPRRAEKKGLPELPSFPQSSKNENLNREIVKSAVSDDVSSEEEERVEFPPLNIKEENSQLLPPRVLTKEISPIRRNIEEFEEEKEVTRAIEVGGDSTPERPMTRPMEPIFVRIDKFQASQESFDKILVKIKEIESTLEKIKKVKSQEEEELSKWALEIEQLKHRLSDIDENIFSQV
jgi:hypothetical protein